MRHRHLRRAGTDRRRREPPPRAGRRLLLQLAPPAPFPEPRHRRLRRRLGLHAAELLRRVLYDTVSNGGRRNPPLIQPRDRLSSNCHHNVTNTQGRCRNDVDSGARKSPALSFVVCRRPRVFNLCPTGINRRSGKTPEAKNGRKAGDKPDRKSGPQISHPASPPGDKPGRKFEVQGLPTPTCRVMLNILIIP